MPRNKHCPRCKTDKDRDKDFYWSTARGGITRAPSSYCKPCTSARVRDHQVRTGYKSPRVHKKVVWNMVNLEGINEEVSLNPQLLQGNKKRDLLQRQARAAVRVAEKVGKLLKTKCEAGPVGCHGGLEWFHHNGYSPENWLEVKCLCARHIRRALQALKDQ